MPQVNFEKKVVAENVEVIDELPRMTSPNQTLSVDSYPIGTDGSDIDEMLDMVTAGKRSEIEIPKEFGNMKAVVSSYWFNNAADFNGDGKKDLLLLRTAGIPELDGEDAMISWLVAILDDGDGKVTPDEEKAGIVIASGLLAGEISPITDIEIGDKNRDGKDDVLWTKGGKRYLATSTSASVPQNADEARDLIWSAMAYYDTVVQVVETAYVKDFIRSEFGAEVELLEPSKAVAIPEVLRPLYAGIKAAAQNQGIDPKIKVLGAILLRDMDQSLTLTSNELTYRTEALSKLSDKFTEFQSSLTLDGKKISRPAYEMAIVAEKDDAKRLKMAQDYEAHFATIYDEGGGYHYFIEQMNSIAKEHGFKNYAEMRIRERFGISLDEFKIWVDRTMASTEGDAKDYIEKLKNSSEQDEIGYWDVGYLSNEWIKNETGMKALPALTETEMFSVVKNLFKDLGFDMKAEPYKNIVMDIYDNELKDNVPGTAATATTTTAYFTSNIEPGKKIPLENLKTVIHELTHDMHYLTAGQTVGGYSTYQNNGYPYVYEALTIAMEDVPFTTPEMMKRYFSGIEGFNDKLFEIYPMARKRSAAWEQRKLLVMALMEINLYENEAPWNDRLTVWEDMVRKYLFVEPKGIKLGQILCRSHPYGEQSQLGYASYPLGAATMMKVRDNIIKDGTQEELARYGEAMRRIMATGATGDLSTLMNELK